MKVFLKKNILNQSNYNEFKISFYFYKIPKHISKIIKF